MVSALTYRDFMNINFDAAHISTNSCNYSSLKAVAIRLVSAGRLHTLEGGIGGWVVGGHFDI